MPQQCLHLKYASNFPSQRQIVGDILMFSKVANAKMQGYDLDLNISQMCGKVKGGTANRT